MRLASWNILADAYVKPERYPRVPAALLEPKARGRAVLARARALDAQVLCLQEVERAAFAALLAGLAADGFEGCFEQKSQGKPDGCAIFWRGAKLLGRDALHYDDGGKKPPSGHLALRVRLDAATGPLEVVTTHFQWTHRDRAPSERRTLRQAEAVVAWLTTREPTRLVLCGDLNVEADDVVLQRLLAGGLRDVHQGAKEPPTCVIGGYAHKVDYVLVRGEMAARPGLAVALEGVNSLPDEREPSDHVPLIVELG